MLNHFRLIANEPLDLNGQHYEAGDELTLHANDCAPLLVFKRARLSTTPAPPAAPIKKRRGRPRKAGLAASSSAA